jgi:hypothetical protein
MTVTHSHEPVLEFFTVYAGEVITFTNVSEHGHYINIVSGSYASSVYTAGDADPREPRGRTSIRTDLFSGRVLAATPYEGEEYVVFYIPKAIVGTDIIVGR